MKENERTSLARDNNLLKEKLLHWMPEPGSYPTAIEGLTIARRQAVGYEIPTQFNREYNRMFGEPPHRHVSQLR